MKFVVEMIDNQLFINGKEEDISKPRCLLFGNIYNLNQFDSSSLKAEEKIIKLYNESPKILKELNGEYVILIISNLSDPN